MNSRHLLALATLGLGVALAAPAGAQTRVDTVEYAGPDRGLLRTGVWTLGLSYVPALIVGIESPLPEDRYLLAPVAGPWLDFAKRDCDDCRHESLNQFMLAADGVVQGVGALEILGSFLFVERTVVSRPASNSKSNTALDLRVVPRRYSGGYGLTAIGHF